MKHKQSKPIEIPSAFDEAPDKDSRGTRRMFTAEQDYAIIKHLDRIGVRKFNPIFREAYNYGSCDTLLKRRRLLVDAGATCENVFELHRKGLI